MPLASSDRKHRDSFLFEKQQARKSLTLDFFAPVCMMVLFFCFFGGRIADELVEGNSKSVSDFDACSERDGFHMIFVVEACDLEATNTGCIHDIDDFHFPFAHDSREMAAKHVFCSILELLYFQIPLS